MSAFLDWQHATFGPGYYCDDNCLVAVDGDQSTVASLWDTSVPARVVAGKRIPARFLVLVLFANGGFTITNAPAVVARALPFMPPPEEKPSRDANAAEQKLSRAMQRAWIVAQKQKGLRQ